MILADSEHDELTVDRVFRSITAMIINVIIVNYIYIDIHYKWVSKPGVEGVQAVAVRGCRVGSFEAQTRPSTEAAASSHAEEPPGRPPEQWTPGHHSVHGFRACRVRGFHL